MINESILNISERKLRKSKRRNSKARNSNHSSSYFTGSSLSNENKTKKKSKFKKKKKHIKTKEDYDSDTSSQNGLFRRRIKRVPYVKFEVIKDTPMGKAMSRDRLIKVSTPHACSPPIGLYNPKNLNDVYSFAIASRRKHHNSSSVNQSEDKINSSRFYKTNFQKNINFQQFPLSCKRHLLIENIDKALIKRNTDIEQVQLDKEDEYESTFASKSVRVEPPQPANLTKEIKPNLRSNSISINSSCCLVNYNKMLKRKEITDGQKSPHDQRFGPEYPLISSLKVAPIKSESEFYIKPATQSKIKGRGLFSDLEQKEKPSYDLVMNYTSSGFWNQIYPKSQSANFSAEPIQHFFARKREKLRQLKQLVERFNKL